MKKSLSLIFLAVLCLSSCSGGSGEAVPESDALPVEREQYMADCLISGTKVSKDYSKVYVYRPDQNMFRDEPVATFKVKKGCFSGTARLDTMLVYELAFTVPGSGMAQVRPFVPTATGVRIVGPEESGNDIELVSESPENDNLNRYSALSFTIDSLAGEYLAEHPMVSSFYLLYQRLQSAFDFNMDMHPWIDLYDRVYADKFPDHPYHPIILSLTGNRVGDHIRDFTLPDTEGVQQTLSTLTAGKIAIVDFWASWCGSCRTRSKALIPVYGKYAGDGFTVVGVALEYKNDAAWRKALARDGYPWTNLLALDAAPSLKANHAKVFVLDRDGTILAIDPAAEELDALLQEKLQK